MLDASYDWYQTNRVLEKKLLAKCWCNWLKYEGRAAIVTGWGSQNDLKTLTTPTLKELDLTIFDLRYTFTSQVFSSEYYLRLLRNTYCLHNIEFTYSQHTLRGTWCSSIYMLNYFKISCSYCNSTATNENGTFKGGYSAISFIPNLYQPHQICAGSTRYVSNKKSKHKLCFLSIQDKITCAILLWFYLWTSGSMQFQ
jgi:hypothetical protein